MNVQVLLVNLDTGALRQTVGDEEQVLPAKLQRTLSTVLQKLLFEAHSDSEVGRLLNVLIPEAVMRVFLECFSSLFAHVKARTKDAQHRQPSPATPAALEERPEFQKKDFIRSVRSRSVRNFLKWFCETNLFLLFLEDFIEGNNTSAIGTALFFRFNYLLLLN